MNTAGAFSLSIADVERDTGLSKDTLRIWERRYGFPAPQRDALGERLYHPAQVQRLHLIRRLLDTGHRPGQVVGLTTTQLQALGQAPAPSRRAVGVRQKKKLAPAVAALDPGWMAWLQTNQTETFRRALQQHWLRHGLAQTVEDLIAPLSVRVGEAWQAGELSVFQEHLYSEVVQAVLREAMAAIDLRTDGAPRGPRVLLTTLPREQHALGLLMAECFLALEGCERRQLGVSTPLAEIVNAAQALQADVVALSCSAQATAQDILQSLRQLRAQLPPGVAIWVGGSATVLHGRRLPEGIVAVRRAPDLAPLVTAWRVQHVAGRP